MSIEIKDTSCYSSKKKSKCWSDVDELKYLICAIDKCKCPRAPPPPSYTIILPPRIEEIPCEIPSREPPHIVPSPRTCCPIIPGLCCPRPLPPPMLPATLSQLRPSPVSKCYPYSPLPCYFNK